MHFKRSYLKRKLKIINLLLYLGVNHLRHGNERRTIETPPTALPTVDGVQEVQGISSSKLLISMHFNMTVLIMKEQNTIPLSKRMQKSFKQFCVSSGYE
jgi:hypothetical protein